jgi:hypothetical protein
MGLGEIDAAELRSPWLGAKLVITKDGNSFLEDFQIRSQLGIINSILLALEDGWHQILL